MKAADPSKSRIVLVGTPAYDNPNLPDVPAVGNNLTDLFKVLTDPDLGGFDSAHCTVAPPRAGVSQIGDLLTDAADEAEDLLLFYYSGHGLLEQMRGELFLSLAETKPGNKLAFSALSFDRVRDACLNSQAKNRVVILDSCFSGRAIGGTLAGETESVLGQIQVAGTYTLASSPANRTSQYLPGERHTAFTGRLLAFLNAGSHEAGPLITLGDIYRHLRTQLKSEGLPAPQQRGTDTADLLGLVRNRRKFIPQDNFHSPKDKGQSTPSKPQKASTASAKEDLPFRGKDLETEVTMSFAAAFSGATAAVRLATKQQCSNCTGSGRVSGSPCAACAGSGRETASRTIRMRIPAGSRNGQRLRLKGMGSDGNGGGPPGDLYVKMHVSPHPVVRQDGDNLTMKVPVTFPEAVFGADIRIPTLGGSSMTMKLPPGSASGRVLRVRGKGMPRLDGGRGDLLLTSQVFVYDMLSEAGEDALRAFQKVIGDQVPRYEGRPRFGRDGKDTTVRVQVTFPELVFGGFIDVPVPGGSTVKVTLPRRSTSGVVLRVHGQGELRTGRLSYDDLLVAFDVNVPIRLSAAEHRALESFQDAIADLDVRDALFAAVAKGS